MRKVLGILLLVGLSACGSQKPAQKQQPAQTNQTNADTADIPPPAGFNNFAEGPPASADTVEISQPDDSKLHIIGFGGMFISYTETIDGYTLTLNQQGIYEYAARGEGGDLIGSGVDARDPKDRSKSDEAFLSNVPKHLRYEGKKLRDLLARQRKWEESVNYGQQYRQYKEEQQKLQEQKNQKSQPKDQDKKKQ